MKQKILLVILMITINACASDNKEADLIILNGTVVTVDQDNPTAEAVAIKADTIMFVGSKQEAEKLAGDNTEIINLNGELVVPGLIESHAHFEGLGNSLLILDLKKAKNWSEVIFMVSEAAENARPGEWILGRGWHQEKWDPAPYPQVHGYPHHDVLSKATPYNPVLLDHASGHAIIANKKAMDIAGVTDKTKSPVGGEIVRDENGKTIGVFKENAEQLITNVYKDYLEKRTPEQVKADFLKKVKAAQDECLKYGITSFHDAGQTFEELDMLKDIADSSLLDVRLYSMIDDNIDLIKEKAVDYRTVGYADNFLTIRAVKRYMDGALGSRGALLIEDYSDRRGEKGLQVTTDKEMNETAKFCLENDFQLCVHAIGDQANHKTLDLYEKYYKQSDKLDLRWRIEHAQHLAASDIQRFAELGVIPVMQTTHCTSDAPYVLKRLGKKRAEESAYPWRKLIESGATIANSTDAPVEYINPFASFYSAVTRKSPDGKAFYPEQKMTREEGLQVMTLNGAKAAFEENIKGSIKVGKLADIAILSRNIMKVNDAEIQGTKALFTIVNGKLKYKYDN